MEINSEREAELFDHFLGEFQSRNNAPPVDHISLVSVYRTLRAHQNPGRLSTYMQELQIQRAFLNIDNCKMMDLDGKLDKSKPLGGMDTFCNRAELLKANSDYIFRYRAIWDKVMAILILIFCPNKFQDFSKCKKKKNKFMKIMKDEKKIPENVLNNIEDTITKFDDMYRTKETHGSGSSRQWSFSYSESPFSDQANMYWAWNALNKIIFIIGRTFKQTSA